MPRMSHDEYIAYVARHSKPEPRSEVADCGSESKLHGDIMQHCKDKRWICFHGEWGKLSRRTPGEPDLTILLPGGRTLLIECKTKTGKLSPEQLAIKVWAESLGHQIHTIRSMQEFLELVNSTEWKKE